MGDQLQPSKLGTKDHWDHVYSHELSNFNEIGDEGEVWFGQDTLEKMRDWVVEHVPPSTAPFILDIGTGNGNVLLELFEAGYNPEQMCGIDYSADAVRLAQHVAEARQASAITFKMLDFLVDKPEKLKSMQIGDDWDLILDKGTYDAMALAARNSDNKSPSEEYPVRVGTILRHGGYFLITSCNFTEEELHRHFVTPDTGLSFQYDYNLAISNAAADHLTVPEFVIQHTHLAG